jgi:hypothetical protein
LADESDLLPFDRQDAACKRGEDVAIQPGAKQGSLGRIATLGQQDADLQLFDADHGQK